MNAVIEKTSEVSRNYADALIEIIKSGRVDADTFLNELEIVNSVVSESKDLNSVLLNPSFTLDIKLEILSAIFKGKVSTEVSNFLNVLVEKNRIKEFPSIYSEFRYKLNEKNNTQPVYITSAVDLKDEQKNRIIATLTKKLNKTILPSWETDRSIIGGIIVKIYDNVIDMSLKGRIDRLSKSLMLK